MSNCRKCGAPGVIASSAGNVCPACREAFRAAAKTIAQRQNELRQRRAQEGLTEVRGIYLMPHQHATLKGMARELAAVTQRAAHITQDRKDGKA